MKTRTCKVIFLAILVALFAVGCENDPSSVPTQGNVLIVSSSSQKAMEDSPSQSNYEPVYYNLEFLESLEFEEFAGTLLPGQGGMLFGQMETWREGGDFAIIVPPEALPDDDPDYPIEFSIRIPTYQTYMDHPDLPLILWLEPSNINFLVPLTVMATYMPWTGLTVDDVFEYLCLIPDFQEYGEPEVFEVDGLVKIQFQAPHFSIWEVNGGTKDNKGRNQ